MLLDMVARLGTALLVTVSAYDLTTRSLSLPLKILVHGTILTVVSSLVLSIMLKRWIAPHKEAPHDAEDPSTARLASRRFTGENDATETYSRRTDFEERRP